MAGSIFNGIVGFLFVCGAGGALAVSVGLYGASLITLGGVYAVFRYTSMLRQPLDRLTRQLNNFQTATAGVVRVKELLATPGRMADGFRAALPRGPMSVEFRNVSFVYDAEPVLSDISFRLEPGEVLGLLGRTGSVKTTISRLLFRLRDPCAGSVRLSDMDLRDVRLDAVRAPVGLVTQDVQLFHGTTVQHVDSIMILEDGGVAELGRRRDLVEDPTSRFARLLRVGLAEALG